MLILFDIDGTLLLTQRAGVNAMHDAGRELFGESFTIDGIEFAGRLDSLIWQDLVRNNSLKDGQAEHDLKTAAGLDPENPTMNLPCRTVFAAGQRQVEVVGPLLADEAAELQADFWKNRA